MQFYLNFLFEENQFFIQLLDKSINQIVINHYYYKEVKLVHTKKHLSIGIELDKVEYFSMTYKSKYLFIVEPAVAVFYFDINTDAKLICKKDVSMSNLRLNQQFEPVWETDDFVLIAVDTKTQSLVVAYLELECLNGQVLASIFQSPKGRSVLNFKVNKNYLCLMDYSYNMNEIILDTQTKLKIFDLSDVKIKKSFDQPLFQIGIHNNIHDYCFSSEYLFLCENLNLNVYRIKDNLKLISVPINQSISQVWSHENNYVNLILANGELVSFILIDKGCEKDFLQKYENVKKIR
jgi:hypothetical protein